MGPLRRRPAALPAGGFNSVDGDELIPPHPLVYGWLLAERGYSRVELRAGDRPPRRVRLHSLENAELAELSPLPSAPISTWSTNVDLRGIAPGTELTLTATAHGSAGELELGSARIVVGERHPVRIDPDWLGELSARTAESAAGHVPGPGLRLMAFQHNLGRSGAVLYAVELIGHLLEDERVSCTVIAPEDGTLRPELERRGAHVHIADRPGHADGYESQMRELVLLAGELGTNAVFANTAFGFDGIDLASRIGVPSIWSIHESLGFDEILYGAFDWADDHVAGRMRAAIDSADAVLFEADATRELFARETSAGAGHLTHLDYGVELGELSARRAELEPQRERLRAERGFEPADRVVLCPGTIEPRKAQAPLALALSSLHAEFPDAVLTLVGWGPIHGDYVQGVASLLERLDLPAGRVRMEPLSDRMEEWFVIADAVALVSDNESMPRVLLEAMAFGLPILSTRVFGIPELIEDGVNGLLCEPSDLDSIAGGLRRLLELSRSEAEALGAAGERTAASRDAGAYALAVREIFDRLLAGRGAPSGSPLG